MYAILEYEDFNDEYGYDTDKYTFEPDDEELKWAVAVYAMPSSKEAGFEIKCGKTFNAEQALLVAIMVFDKLEIDVDKEEIKQEIDQRWADCDYIKLHEMLGELLDDYDVKNKAIEWYYEELCEWFEQEAKEALLEAEEQDQLSWGY